MHSSSAPSAFVPLPPLLHPLASLSLFLPLIPLADCQGTIVHLSVQEEEWEGHTREPLTFFFHLTPHPDFYLSHSLPFVSRRRCSPSFIFSCLPPPSPFLLTSRADLVERQIMKIVQHSTGQNDSSLSVEVGQSVMWHILTVKFSPLVKLVGVCAGLAAAAYDE